MQDFVMTEEQKQLAEKHHDLIYKVMKEWDMDIDECYGDMAIGLCLATSVVRNCCRDEDFDKIATAMMVAEVMRPSSKYYY